MTDRRPTIINTGSDGSGGWAIAVILLVAVIGLCLYLFGGSLFSGSDSKIDVDVSLPKAEAPAVPKK